MEAPKDALIICTKDNPEQKEFLMRLQPGDEVGLATEGTKFAFRELLVGTRFLRARLYCALRG